MYGPTDYTQAHQPNNCKWNKQPPSDRGYVFVWAVGVVALRFGRERQSSDTAHLAPLENLSLGNLVARPNQRTHKALLIEN